MSFVFHKGDIVRVIHNCDNDDISIGDEGVIVGVYGDDINNPAKDFASYPYAVDWGRKIDGGSDAEGNCESGHCWPVKESEVELVGNEREDSDEPLDVNFELLEAY